jgi:hypothetical protein
MEELSLPFVEVVLFALDVKVLCNSEHLGNVGMVICHDHCEFWC